MLDATLHLPIYCRSGQILRVSRKSAFFCRIDAAGIEKPAEWNGEPIPEAPGISLASAFTDAGFLPSRRLWWLHEGHRAMRIGDWKLVAAKDEPWELYDLTEDRAEQHDLIRKHPEKARGLRQAWDDLTTGFTNLIRER